MKTVTLRGVVIGEGRPRVCVPLTGAAVRELAGQTASAVKSGAEIIEWRADYYEDIADIRAVKSTLELLRGELGGLPLLFTARTAREGGGFTADSGRYADLLTEIAASGLADAVDVELFAGDDIVRRVVGAAVCGGAVTVVSNHDFEGTPKRGEIIARLARMRGLGADIPKIAVTPKGFDDVMELMSAVYEYTRTADRPVIAMSMTKPGCVSRLAGQYYGSAVTFGSAGEQSAPGQLEAAGLRAALELIS